MLILVAFPLQQWLNERAPTLRYTYIVCLVRLNFISSLFSNTLLMRHKVLYS